MNSDYTDQLNKAMESIEAAFRRNLSLTRVIITKINEVVHELTRVYRYEPKIKIMNFCGTHEWTVTHYGIRSLIPSSIVLVAGPGCPICVTPSHFIEESIRLALDDITIYTYGDVYRLRAIRPVKGVYSLSEAKAHGASVKIITSIAEAINDARAHGKESVFVGIGFETVASGYARAILSGMLPPNLKFLSVVKLTPPAMKYTLEIHRQERLVKGVIAPGHVSTIIGAKAWHEVSKEFGIPIVVSGFEPIDVLLSILEILRQLVKGKADTVIEYKRAVTWDGDLEAQKMIREVFEVVDDAWRGIGFIPRSGLRLKKRFRMYDAFGEYGVRDVAPGDWVHDLSPGCRCADVILGRAMPSQCPLFMKTCTPSTPVGPCMVSIEGTCSIWAKHRVLDVEAIKDLEAIQ